MKTRESSRSDRKSIGRTAKASGFENRGQILHFLTPCKIKGGGAIRDMFPCYGGVSLGAVEAECE